MCVVIPFRIQRLDLFSKKKDVPAYVLFLTPRDSIGGEGGPLISGAGSFGVISNYPSLLGGAGSSSSDELSIFFDFARS